MTLFTAGREANVLFTSFQRLYDCFAQNRNRFTLTTTTTRDRHTSSFLVLVENVETLFALSKFHQSGHARPHSVRHVYAKTTCGSSKKPAGQNGSPLLARFTTPKNISRILTRPPIHSTHPPRAVRNHLRTAGLQLHLLGESIRARPIPVSRLCSTFCRTGRITVRKQI